ncbi:MAG: hypothetical protein ACQETL_18035 [Bacteroidota bacterium]
MSRIPESYYFYKDQLRRVKEEKAILKKEYESKINGLNEEITYLKEQIHAQHIMIEQSVEYVLKLEEQIKIFDLEISSSKNN